jgi:hypothetical protein
MTPALLAHVEDGAAAADPHVVVEEVEPAEPVQRRLDHRRALRGLGDVGLERDGLAALLVDHRDGSSREITGAIDHDDPRARLGEQDGGGAAVADTVARRAAPRDDGDLPLESPVVRDRVHRRLLLSWDRALVV